MPTALTHSPRHGRIASHVPGRLRFQLADPGRMNGLAAKLQAQQGIDSVRMNRACHSITVHYDRKQHSPDDMLELLSDLDVVLGSTVPIMEGDKPDLAKPVEFLSAIEHLDARLTAATGLPINLKQLLPLSFAAAGLWSIGKRGLQIEQVPGWLFLWFAFDMFVKLHPLRSHAGMAPARSIR